jgi:dihydroorotase
MLTDRRPILLANARVVDPSRDFDGPGDVLIADGMIRDSKARHRRRPACPKAPTSSIAPARSSPPADRHARLCRRARRQPPRNLCFREPGGGRRRHHHHHLPADTSPVIDNSATVDFVLRRARDTAIVNIHPMAALTKGMRGEEMTEIGLLKAAGAVAFHRRRQERHQCAGDAARTDLCARFRRADRAPHRGSRLWSAKA